MHTTKKISIFSCLLIIISLAWARSCQAEGNRTSAFLDYFEKGIVVGPKKSNRPKQDWDVKPEEEKERTNSVSFPVYHNKDLKSFIISGLFETNYDYHFRSKDIKSLFHSNEYEY